MENVEKERREKFEKLLTKICKDFRINNDQTIVKRFLEKRKKRYKN